MFKPGTIYAVLAPMYYVTKILGLSPFKITEHGYEKSKLNFMWSVIVALWLHTWSDVILSLLPLDDDTVIFKALGLLDTISSQGGVFVIVVFGLLFLNDILLSISTMDAFDKAVQSGFNVDLKKELRKGQVWVVVGLLATFAFNAFALYFTGTIGGEGINAFGEFLFYTGPTTMNAFVTLQFCSLLLCVKQRFGWLNLSISRISTIAKTQDATYLNTSRYQECATFLESIRRKHFTLCTVGKKLNKAFSLQILMVLMENFVMVLLTVYLTAWIMNYIGRIPYEYIAYNLAQVLINFTQVVVIVGVCSATAKEARKVGVLIHELPCVDGVNIQKKDMQLELTFFSLQLLHHNVDLTACGLFKLDMSLLSAIVGSIITYLVIVMQLDQAESLG